MGPRAVEKARVKRVLVTGGAGYIGAQAVALLLARGDEVVVLDDLSHGTRAAVAAAEAIAGRRCRLEIGDVGDGPFLDRVLAFARPEWVIHLAAHKSVEASVRDPAATERANVGSTRVLADRLRAQGCGGVVFASTAAVYGDAEAPEAIPEEAPLRPLSPYADTKARCESLLDELAAGGVPVRHLRFFNVCGAHPTGRLGEEPGSAGNLLPLLLEAARTGSGEARIFGTDWPTRDGTPIRDYVHVHDVAVGILVALDAMAGGSPGARGSRAYNLGTGRGTTVLEMIAAVEAASGRPLRRITCPRRPGDPAVSVAAVRRAAAELGWTARFDVRAMAEHAWRWAGRSRW